MRDVFWALAVAIECIGVVILTFAVRRERRIAEEWRAAAGSLFKAAGGKGTIEFVHSANCDREVHHDEE